MNKSEINDAVTKVREVVNGVSNNDIILALHSFDFNVEKTIQAFCEDGASGVLDDWVRPAGSTNKKNKNKKKKANGEAAAPPPPVTAPSKPNRVAAPAAAPSASPAPVAVVPTPKPLPKPTAAPASVNRAHNGEKAPVPATSSNSIQGAFQALRDAISEREHVLLSSSNNNSSFIGDVNQLIAQIRNFGSLRDSHQHDSKSPQPKSVSPVQTGIKHATSQSSLSSSVGADSGVNLSPTHQEDKKPAKNAKVAQVASGGIQMSSDALSEDQLAALQRSLQESLAARGIDVSVLSGVSNGDVPRKNPQPKRSDRKGGQQGGKANGPSLTIMNNA